MGPGRVSNPTPSPATSPGAAPPRATPRCSGRSYRRMAEIGEGAPEPLGVTADAAGVNVAVVAPDATAIEFCLFDAVRDTMLACHRLPARSGDVWHGHIRGMAPGARYGLRAHGPWDPGAGHVFDPSKLLL